MKINECESANGDFPCAKLQNAKKKLPKFTYTDYGESQNFILMNIFSPIFVQNLVTLVWKMRPGMPKEAGSINGPLCAYLIRQNLHNGLVQDLWAINVIATFQNDPWKFTDLRVLAVIFHVQSWTMQKKKLPKVFVGDYEKTRNLCWLTCLSPTFEQIWWLKLEKWVQECLKRLAH